MKKQAVIFWVLTFLIMAGIFYFSAQTAVESTEVSYGLAQKIVEAVLSVTDMTRAEIKSVTQNFESVLRSLAHYTVFLLLGITSYLAVYFTKNKKHMYKSMYSVVLCLSYAIFDEIHQIFVPGRTFQVSDIITDAAGSITGTLIVIATILLLNRRKIKR